MLVHLDHQEKLAALEILASLEPLENLEQLVPWERGVHLDPRACRAFLDPLVYLACLV